MAAPPAQGVAILARTLFRELSANGYDARQILTLATALIAEVTASLRGTRRRRLGPPGSEPSRA
jgi:hypothetical protein